MPAKAKVKGHYTLNGGSTALFQVVHSACRVLGTPGPHFQSCWPVLSLSTYLPVRPADTVGTG